MNHWRRAIETHNTNFPHADHVCADISASAPRRYPSTHVLITSPECRAHSQAKTKKAMATLFDPHGADEAERSRATMMDVPRFAEYHNYEIVVVENVVEVAKWAGYQPWLMYMTNLGYDHRVLSLNSLIAHPTPQSRDRLYMVFWKKGNPAPNLDFHPTSWCAECGELVAGVQTFRRPDRHVGKYRQQYDYRCNVCHTVVYPLAYPAASAIDWSLPAPRIGDRARPLAPATRRRIEVGLDRFGRPAVIQSAGHTYERPGSGYVRAWPADGPLPAQTATLAHGLAVPAWLVSTTRQHDADRQPNSLMEPFPTQTSQAESGLATLPAFFLKNYGNAGEAQYRAHPITDPWGAITAYDSQSLVTMPFIAELRGGSSDARSIEDPLATVTAAGNHHGLVVPAFYVKNYGTEAAARDMAKPITDPLGTVTTVDHHAVVQLPFLTSYYSKTSPSSIVDPVPTVTAHERHALVESALSVDDCGFRMLEPHEIQAAMAFHADYIVTGSKRERVRQLGNAVCPPVMHMILERCVETLA